jgi:hypothetical protein
MNRRLIGVGLATLMTMGCSKAFTPETVAGLWILRTVNGSTLPFEFNEGSNTVRITSGLFNLREDLTYSFTLEVLIDDGTSTTPESQEDTGTYLLIDPDRIDLTSSVDGSTFTATLVGANITAVADGLTFVFERV